VGSGEEDSPYGWCRRFVDGVSRLTAVGMVSECEGEFSQLREDLPRWHRIKFFSF